jgi:hypothetical protein
MKALILLATAAIALPFLLPLPRGPRRFPIEDCLIVMMMSQPATISDRTINLLTAIIQIFVLGLAGAIRN